MPCLGPDSSGRDRAVKITHRPTHSLLPGSAAARGPPPITETLNGRVYRTDGGAEDAAAGWVLAFLCFSSSARKARFSGLEPVRSRNPYVDGPGSGKCYLLCQNVFCSATGERRQSRPNPLGSSTAWSSST